MPANDIGDGTTIVFGTSGFTAYVDSIRWSGQGREMIDMSHIGTTGGMPFLPSDMYDPGTLQLELHHDPDVDPPLTDAMETITVTFPLRSGITPAKFQATGALQNIEFGAAKREKITSSATFKLSGTPTFTAEV